MVEKQKGDVKVFFSEKSINCRAIKIEWRPVEGTTLNSILTQYQYYWYKILFNIQECYGINLKCTRKYDEFKESIIKIVRVSIFCRHRINLMKW